jgi:hypothetical protein
MTVVGEATRTSISSIPTMTRKSKLRRKHSNDHQTPPHPTPKAPASRASVSTTPSTTTTTTGRKKDAARSSMPSTSKDDSSSSAAAGSAVDDDANHIFDPRYGGGSGYASTTDDEGGIGDDNNDYDDDQRSVDSAHAPPFLPLEEQNQAKGGKHHRTRRHRRRRSQFLLSNPLSFLPEPVLRYVPSGKQIVSTTMAGLIVLVLYDALLKAPEDRFLKPEKSLALLVWVQHHPLSGLFWITVVIAACVVVMIPLGTPLTLGCGYVYKGAYGWKVGVLVATLVSMGGSCLGAVICFLLGRYLMRDTVKKWVRKYPLFDAIDVGTLHVAAV